MLVSALPESFIEVSEGEELSEEDAGDSHIQDKLPSGDVDEEEYKEEEEEPVSSPADGLEDREEEENSGEEVKEEEGRDSSSTPVTNEWEHIDAVSRKLDPNQCQILAGL